MSAGDDIEVDLRAGTVTNHTAGKRIQTQGFSDRMLAVLAADGLVPYLERHVRRDPGQVA